MAGFLAKLFGKKDNGQGNLKGMSLNEAELILAKIKNEVMNLVSKGKHLDESKNMLREEIRRKEQKYNELMDEYIRIKDGLEKNVLLGDLATLENELEGVRRRVNGLNQSCSDNARLIQTMKQACEWLEAAISAGASPKELAEIINEVAQIGEVADIRMGFLEGEGDKLGGKTTTAEFDANCEKVLAKIEARKAANVSADSQK